MIIVGINAYHPDASVALMRDGELVWAAEEERYSRIKHASGFPVLALRACLEENNINSSDIHTVAISKNPRANFLRKMLFVLANRPAGSLVFDRLKAFKRSSGFQKDFAQALNLPAGKIKAKFIHVEHHEAHAASSFFMSGFEKGAFLTLDGLGDFASASWGIGQGSRLEMFDRVFFPHSAGFLYTACTQFLGFHNFGDEYKVMGLAGYGKPEFLQQMRKIVYLKPQGQFELNLKYFTHPKGQSKVRWEGGAPKQDVLCSPEWSRVFGFPRSPDGPLLQRDFNLAASLQAILEEIYFHVLEHVYQKTRMDTLCLAGGVAFNSVANGKIVSQTPFKKVYIQPAAGDAGAAVGAAAYAAYALYRQPRGSAMRHAMLGTAASDESIQLLLESRRIRYEQLSELELIRQTVDVIDRGGVVGWFQGRMEFGPRALGNRSILTDPRRADMKDILNRKIKHRESFRPFAPAIPVERAKDFFDMDCEESPFMLRVVPVREDKKRIIPAVTHVDGTARVQTVSKDVQPLFWELLTAFGHKTGVPILLNTSFNENEPIVCTPEEALECYLKTRMDALVLGRFYLERKS